MMKIVDFIINHEKVFTYITFTVINVLVFASAFIVSRALYESKYDGPIIAGFIAAIICNIILEESGVTFFPRKNKDN